MLDLSPMLTSNHMSNLSLMYNKYVLDLMYNSKYKLDLNPMSDLSLIYIPNYLYDLILMSIYKPMSNPMSKYMMDLIPMSNLSLMYNKYILDLMPMSKLSLMYNKYKLDLMPMSNLSLMYNLKYKLDPNPMSDFSLVYNPKYMMDLIPMSNLSLMYNKYVLHSENLTKGQWKKPQKLLVYIEKCLL